MNARTNAGSGRPVLRAAVALLPLLVVGCTPQSAGSMTDAWAVVTPAGLAPSALFVGPGGVLVGGASDSARSAPDSAGARPLLAVQEPAGWQDVPMTASTYYGSVATMLYAAIDPDGRIVAMGTATGGAHLNPRWSAWVGSVNGVVEEPQTTETFGGPEAGGITGVVSGAVPAIIGTWSVTPAQAGVAVWHHDGAIWARQPSPPVFAGSAAAQVTATAATAGDSGVVIVGLETSFRAGVVHQRAVAWTSDPDVQAWNRIDLDTSDQDSAATDVACAADSCTVVGRLGDALGAWRIDGTSASAVTSLPHRAIDHYLGQPRVAMDPTTVAIAVGDTNGLLTTTSGGGWMSSTTPAGEVRQLGVGDGEFYLLLRTSDDRQVVYRRAV